MREIKFRAFLKLTKEIVNVNKIDFENNQISFYKNNGDAYSYVCDFKNIELMQFTGLHDKNGKDIYEGDIVKILYTDWTSKSDNDNRTLEEYLDSLARIGIVYWDDLSLCYTLKMKNDCFSSIHCGKYGYIEVIGNIYDNPELLEGL